MMRAILLITKLMIKIKISQHPNINEILKEHLKYNVNQYQNWWDSVNIDDDYDDEITDDAYFSCFKPQNKENDKKLFEEKDIYYVDYMTPYFSDESFKKDVIHFKSVHQLQTFCETNGINVDKNELNYIINRKVSYCTIDPMVKDVTLISDSSWVSLYYDTTYCDCDNLSK